MHEFFAGAGERAIGALMDGVSAELAVCERAFGNTVIAGKTGGTVFFHCHLRLETRE